MNPDDPPRPTGREGELESLDGCQLFITNEPASEDDAEMLVVQIHNGSVVVPVFSTDETRARFERDFSDLARGKPVAVTDTIGLLYGAESQGFQVALDLHRTEDVGSVKYSRIESPWLKARAQYVSELERALCAGPDAAGEETP